MCNNVYVAMMPYYPVGKHLENQTCSRQIINCNVNTHEVTHTVVYHSRIITNVNNYSAPSGVFKHMWCVVSDVYHHPGSNVKLHHIL